MIKALTKFGFSAGAITGTICAGETVLTESGELQKKLSKAQKTLKQISKFEEIDIYARENGCSFVFIKGWTGKEVYNAEEFVKLEEKVNKESIDWRTKAWEGANNNKSSCRKGATVALAYSRGNKNRFNKKEK